MIMNLMDWHKIQREKKIDVMYSGPLWSEGIGEIARTLQKHLEHDKVPPKNSQEIVSVFIEQLNNMLMYSAENIEEYPGGSFIMGKTGSCFYIQTGNVMKEETVNMIKERIDYLNSLNKDDIRKYYKEQMKLEDRNPDSKGSGLGFIEIARRINSKMKYSFENYKSGLVFFTLYVTMEAGGENE